MAEAAGVEIPKGSPGELNAAAEAWSQLEQVLTQQVQRLNTATESVTGADWHGEASAAYAMSSGSLSMVFLAGAGACIDAAAACRHFARALHAAQHRAREAKHRAEEAIRHRDVAREHATDARRRQAAADGAALDAGQRASRASVAGPAGASALARAQADGRDAARARDAAADALRRAEAAERTAERDLQHARREGEDANREAEDAGRAAARAFAALAAAAQPAPTPGAPVPVSLNGARPDLAALNPSFGGPFHAPGRYATPAQARAAQIARQNAADQDAADADKPHKGSILDGLSGLIHDGSFGVVDLGGDKSSDRYRGGQLASLIPISPTGIARDAEKLGARVVAREGEHAAAHRGPRLFRPTSFGGKKVYQRDDLIDPLRKGPDGRTNAERMADGDAPFGPDGKPLNLHHTTQRDDSPVAELTQTFHTRNRRVIHVNWPPKNFPSGIDRAAFDRWREDYWKHRGLDFPPDAP